MRKLSLNDTTDLDNSSVSQAGLAQDQPADGLAQTAFNPEQTPPASKKNNYLWLVVVLVVSVALGVATGFGASKLYGKSSSASTPVAQVPEEGQIKAGDVFGTDDENFKDEAQGYLEAGGIDGEGSHKLLRPGGPSQTVYLTSSVTDLDKFVGMEVKVYGETYKGQKAGWLMDVGKVEVINPKGQKPPETHKLN